MIDGTILAILIVLVPLAWGRARYWKGWHEGRADLLREQESPPFQAETWGTYRITQWFTEPFDREAE